MSNPSESAGYNGWHNYETWAVKLWIDNERAEYDYWRNETVETWANTEATEYLTRSQAARFSLADSLKEWHQDNTPDLSGPFCDLLNAALSEIDWDEIADAMLTDAELDGYEVRS